MKHNFDLKMFVQQQGAGCSLLRVQVFEDALLYFE
jgi:hypothetical protein